MPTPDSKLPVRTPEGFLEAWKEPRHGFDVSWLEIEILSSAIRWISVANIRERISKQYKHVAEMPLSSYYRVVQNLVQREYLDSRKHGRTTLIQLAQKGGREIGRAGRYFFDRMTQGFKLSYASRLMEIVEQRVGPSWRSTIVASCYEVEDIQLLLEAWKEMDKKHDNVAPDDTDTASHYFLVLKGKGQILSHTDPGIQMLQGSYNDGVLRTNAADVFISASVLRILKSLDEEEEFLREIKRIVRPGGLVVIQDMTTDAQTPLLEMWKHLTFFQQLSQDGARDWNYQWAKYSKEEYMSLLSKYFDGVEVLMDGVVTVFGAINKE